MPRRAGRNERMKKIREGKTRNYDMFRAEIGNRDYREIHAKKIAQDICKKNMLEISPIVCVERNGILYIIDGQHRHGACKMLGIDLHYVVVDGLDGKDIAILNRSQKGWSAKDYLKHYAENGNENYLKLKKFVEVTNLPVTLAARLLSGKVSEGGGGSQEFKDGCFEVDSTDFAFDVVKCLNKMQESGCTFSRERSLVCAIYHIMKNVPEFAPEQLAQKIKDQGIQKRSNWRDYALYIEELYNYRQKYGNRLQITAELKNMPIWKD